MEEQIQQRNSSFKKRPNIKNTEYISEQFLLSYDPEEKYKFENFEIQTDKKIGTGFLSNVYLSTNKIDSLQYAVKKINKKNVLNKGISLDIIKNEIEIHERILHPNIVRMYSHYEDEKNYYCFLEYINGPSLLNFIHKKKTGLSERESCKFFSQIIKSISFLHSNKIIHRDIKLENFLIKNNEIIKLIDFGCCALLTEEEPKRMSTCGTYLYMSPELIDLKPYDYCVDIWALGVLLFELLEGFSPFGKRDDDQIEIKSNVLTKKFKVTKDLSNNCLDLLNKMLEFDYHKRIDIKGICEHNWIKDWGTDNGFNNNFNGNNFNNNDDDNDELNSLLSLVKKKNMKGKKERKKKGNSIAKGAKYEKKKIDFKKDNVNDNNDIIKKDEIEEKKIIINEEEKKNEIEEKKNEINEEEKKDENEKEKNDINKEDKKNEYDENKIVLNKEEKKDENEKEKIEMNTEDKKKEIKNEEKEINSIINKEIIEEKKEKDIKKEEKKGNIPINYIKNEPKIINENIKLDDFDEEKFYNINNINSFKTGYNNKQNQNKFINDDNDDFLSENLLNIVNDSKNIEKQNISFNEDDSNEINTNKSNLERKKQKQNKIKNNYYYMNTDYSYNRSQQNSHRSDESDLKNTLALFAKADKLKKESAKIKLKTKEKSFWDKLFSPFQCGSTNNNS